MKFKVLDTVIHMGVVHYAGEIIDIDEKHGLEMPEIFEKVKKKSGNTSVNTNEHDN